MDSAWVFQILADLVRILHFGYVLFVIGGLVCILLGNQLGWPWVNGHWFRFTHLAAIGVVVIQSWLDLVCPLTSLESWLRVQAGGAGYEAGFISYWVGRMLFYEAPTWIFTLGYSLFGVLVLFTWWKFPLRKT